MPIDENASLIITAFDHVPRFAHGVVRDLRVRWACEETGRPYQPQFLDAMEPRTSEYLAWQPYGQVPALADGDLRMFESGAILLYLGEQDERLLPKEGAARWRTITWLIAALNSVEPALMQIVSLDVFKAREPWAKAARPSAVEMARARLASTEAALGEREWFAGGFSIADIMMVTVLRNLGHTTILEEFPCLAAYKARGEARPAFQRALTDQLAAYREKA